MEPLGRSENWSCVVIFLLSPKFSPITIPPLIGLSVRKKKQIALVLQNGASQLCNTDHRERITDWGRRRFFAQLLPNHFLFLFLTLKFGTRALLLIGLFVTKCLIAGFYSIQTKIRRSSKFDQAGAAITAIITSTGGSVALQFKAFGGIMEGGRTGFNETGVT